MTLHDEVQLEAGSEPSALAPAPRSPAFGSFRLLQVLLFGLTVAGVILGWRIAVPGGIAPAIAVSFGLTLAWALVGIVDSGARERPAGKASPFHLLAAIDALVAAVALGAGRKADLAARLERRAGRRHARRPCRDGHLVPLPPCAARRPAARLRAACSGGGRLRGGDRRRACVRPGPPCVQPGRWRHQLDHRGPPGDRADAQPLHRIDRPPPGADGMVRHRDLACGDGCARGDGAPFAGGLAGAARRGGGGGDRARPARSVGRREQAIGAARQQGPGPGARRVRLRRRRVCDLPGGRPRPGSRTEDHWRQGGPCPLDDRIRGGRPHLRPRPRTLPRFGHPICLRVAGSPRRSPAHVREQAHPRHPNGRAPPPTC